MTTPNKSDEVEDPACPRCGDPIEPEWVRCPACGVRPKNDIRSPRLKTPVIEQMTLKYTCLGCHEDTTARGHCYLCEDCNALVHAWCPAVSFDEFLKTGRIS
jgi:hypothetical protein